MSERATPQLRFRVDAGWTPAAIESARAYELAKYLSKHLSTIAPHLLPCLSPILDRLSPLRLGHGSRQLRAWGRDYAIAESDTKAIELLVEGYVQGVPRVGLPASSFSGSPAVSDGIIKHDDGRGVFWIEEPKEEKNRPALVVLPELVSARDFKEETVGGVKLRAKKEAMALMVLQEHPDWKDIQIAAAVGCDRASLYRMKRYKAARQILKEGREEFREWDQGRPRRGEHQQRIDD